SADHNTSAAALSRSRRRPLKNVRRLGHRAVAMRGHVYWPPSGDDGVSSLHESIDSFVTGAVPPAGARAAAARAVLDTIGVALAGASEPAARSVQKVIAEGAAAGRCRVVGTSICASATNAALANGTAAHAHDFDDMCFVSLAHPSAPLVASA